MKHTRDAPLPALLVVRASWPSIDRISIGAHCRCALRVRAGNPRGVAQPMAKVIIASLGVVQISPYVPSQSNRGAQYVSHMPLVVDQGITSSLGSRVGRPLPLKGFNRGQSKCALIGAVSSPRPVFYPEPI